MPTQAFYVPKEPNTDLLLRRARMLASKTFANNYQSYRSSFFYEHIGCRINSRREWMRGSFQQLQLVNDFDGAGMIALDNAIVKALRQERTHPFFNGLRSTLRKHGITLEAILPRLELITIPDPRAASTR